MNFQGRRPRVKKTPAQKPKAHQWHYPCIGGVFVCGQCKRPFNSRVRLQRHKKTVHDPLKVMDTKFKKLIHDKLTTNQRKKYRKEQATCMKARPRGRPRTNFYPCKHCRVELESAEKKRDHQRRCHAKKAADSKSIIPTSTLP